MAYLRRFLEGYREQRELYDHVEGLEPGRLAELHKDEAAWEAFGRIFMLTRRHEDLPYRFGQRAYSALHKERKQGFEERIIAIRKGIEDHLRIEE